MAVVVVGVVKTGVFRVVCDCGLEARRLSRLQNDAAVGQSFRVSRGQVPSFSLLHKAGHR